MKNSKIIYTISKKSDGTMKKNKKPVSRNIRSFLLRENIAIENAKCMKQIHSGDVAVVDGNSQFITENVDGIVTKSKKNTLMVFTADCVPVTFFDEENEVIAIAHAGYKGILKNIVENTIYKIEELGGDRSKVKAIIGPAIGECCYDVDKKRVDMFVKSYPSFKHMYVKRDGKYFLNLSSIVRQILEKEGIIHESITSSATCTKCDSNYFSYRRDEGSSYGEFITAITMV